MFGMIMCLFMQLCCIMMVDALVKADAYVACLALMGCTKVSCPSLCRNDWGSCEAPNKANIERFTALLAKCMKKAIDAGECDFAAGHRLRNGS